MRRKLGINLLIVQVASEFHLVPPQQSNMEMVYDASDSVYSSSLLEEEKVLVDTRSSLNPMDPNSGTGHIILCLFEK